ncbi:hypothetical protein DRQ09_09675, partial [candidate division KSB1 bacterium]
KEIQPHIIEYSPENREKIFAEINASPLKEGNNIVGCIAILRNITQHKLLEESLRESEEKYRNLVEYMLEGIAVARDVPIRLVYANTTLANMVGYTVEELLSFSPENLMKLIHPDDRGLFFQRYEARLRGEEVPSRYEFRAIRKDGSVIWAKISSSQIIYKGKPAIQASFIDITEQKKSEKELQLMKFSIEHSEDSVFWIDSSANIIYVNNTACRSLGYSRDELLSMKIYDIDLNYTEEKWKEKWENLKKNRTITVESLHRTRNGKIFPVEVLFNYLKVDDKEYNFAFVRDITERKKSEEELRASEQLYRSLFEDIADPILIFDQETYRFLDCNKSAIKRYGYTREEFLNMAPHNLHPSEELKIVEKNIDDQETILPHRYTHITKYGEKFPVEIHTQEIMYKGKKAWISIIRDITERIKAEEEKRKLQEQLFYAQKMESIGRLAGGIAHDFNNILTSVMGYAELLKMEFPDTTTSEGKAVDVILRGTERAANLTKQLLGFARGGKYNPVPININDVIRDVVSMSEKIFEKNIDVNYEFEQKVKTIEADRTQMEQVLTNLIINAKDAMPLGGTLTFRTENIYIDKEYSNKYPEFKTGNYVKISVSDTGIGMTEEVKKHIFEPFFTTKGLAKGTGLGLATVYGIIKNHNGYINVYSEAGKGTTFNIYLPASTKIAVRKEKNEKIFRGSGTILLIDDEEDVRNVAVKQLESLGYKVITASDGIKAIDIYARNRNNIDLILLDMIMPGMSGIKTYLNLKKINPDVKVLIISGFSQNGRATELLEKGATGFIQKPFNLYRLSEIIYKTLKE